MVTHHVSSLYPVRSCRVVCNADGTWVLPEQVVGPDQPGRKICMLGVTDNLMSASPWVQTADAIVLGADAQVLRITLAQTDTLWCWKICDTVTDCKKACANRNSFT